MRVEKHEADGVVTVGCSACGEVIAVTSRIEVSAFEERHSRSCGTRSIDSATELDYVLELPPRRGPSRDV